MFRTMRRFRQQLSDEQCESLLTTVKRGVLSVHGEDGYPYGIPIDFVYDNGKIYFHGARQGHKINALKKDSRVCFTLYDEGVLEEGKLGLNVNSVVIFGRIRIIEDREENIRIARLIGYRYDPKDFVDEDLKRTGSVVQCLELTIDHMTGKRVNES